MAHYGPKKIRLAFGAALALLAIFPLNAQEPRLKRGPLSPAFVEWQAASKAKRADAAAMQAIQEQNQTGQGNVYRLGYIPEPFEFPKLGRPATQIEKMVKAGLAIYPDRYDLRDAGILPPIRSQSPFGTCWAFAVLASMESNIRKAEGGGISLSPWHLAWFTYNPINVNGQPWPAHTKNPVEPWEDDTFDQGGNTTRALAMLARGTGPVLEASAPYQSTMYYPASSLPTGREATAATVQRASLFNTDDREIIKGLVMANGAVAASYHAIQNNPRYFNQASYAYRYTGGLQPNHGINVVGWDDGFPRGSFPAGNQPAADGAWIIRNSWGPNWGDRGYFYMSYDTDLLSFSSLEATSGADSTIYQHDLLEPVGGAGYLRDTAWFANVFTAEGSDTIADVAFYTRGANSTYSIIVKKGVTGDPGTGAQAAPAQAGALELPGYHRIRLEEPVNVGSGERFAVLVRLTTPGQQYPVSCSWPEEEWTEGATSSPGLGFMSEDGTGWEDATEMDDNLSVCLKAFGQGISVSIEPKAVALSVGSGYAIFTATVTGGSGNTDVTWTASGGTIAQADGHSCYYNAPAVPGPYTVTATSAEDPTKYGTAAVTVIGGVIIVDPPKGLIAGDTATFTASVPGSGNQAVTWAASAGDINRATGQYTAPAAAQTVTITATSAESPSISSSAYVKISSAAFDGNSKASPQLLDFANAFGSTSVADLAKYDLNNDGKIDEEDLLMLLRAMEWL